MTTRFYTKIADFLADFPVEGLMFTCAASKPKPQYGYTHFVVASYSSGADANVYYFTATDESVDFKRAVRISQAFLEKLRSVIAETLPESYMREGFVSWPKDAMVLEAWDEFLDTVKVE